ncbi:MAG: DNA recombination protein RmuC [Lentisphaerota bacterium]
MMTPADAIILLVLAVLIGLNVYAIIRRARETTESRSVADDLARLNERLQQALAAARQESAESAAAQRRELLAQMQELGRTLQVLLSTLGEGQQRRIAELTATQQAQFEAVRKTLDSKLESLRGSVGEQLDKVRQDNAVKLEEMRRTVDEKLHDTLEKRLGESFKQVSERLEQVHKGLGEMQALAVGVGDLKKVLTNVKTRGSWGEVQLGALLEQLLTADQYAAQVRVRPRSTETVDFAIRLPGRDDGDTPVWLPIDAKFPKEDYERLSDAAERGDAAGVETAVRQLEARIRQDARDIRDKYIAPPDTTDFAILYLPTEGLYAEVLRRPGLADFLQRDCRVVVAGPTTLAALLNSLQMGFRTLAIQKRSSEVWKLLAAVKKKFEGFGETFSRVQKKIQEADKALDDARSDTEIIGKRLRLVESADEAAVRDALALPGGTDAE